MHGRANEPAGQGQLVRTSQVFFAGFELLTLVLKGARELQGRETWWLSEGAGSEGKVGQRDPIVGSYGPRRMSRPDDFFVRAGALDPQFRQQIGWVDRFGEQIEVIALRAGLFQKICGRGLS